MCHIAFVLALVAGISCSSDADVGVVQANLTLRAIALESSSVPAGAVRFVARNIDEGRHELVILRTDRPADDLPMRASRVATEARGMTTVARVEPFDGPATRTTTADLEAGSYVLICNLAGHYMLGMHARLPVA